ncbi:MAG TPA: NADP-dependent oxidoreductase, partial [Propionibacteriaceae bacterium]|nr:NADP-dependent oxidoreductase [Propionibacteriaceae bacterium]
VVDVPLPQPGPGQVRIAVKASGVNPFDWRLRQGLTSMRVSFPAGISQDAAGVVTALGEGVENVEVGDEVFGSTGKQSAAAEEAVLVAFALKPANLTWEEAGSAGLGAETAMRCLRLLGLSAGQTLLIDGASGGVGLAALQFAVDKGLHVIGTANPAKHELVAGLGGAPVSYGDGLADRVRQLSPQGVDGVIQAAGDSLDDLLTLVDDPAKVVTIVDFGAAAKGAQVSGGRHREWDAALAGIVTLAEKGAYVVRVGRTFGLDQAGEAQAYSAAGGDGRAVIVP